MSDWKQRLKRDLEPVLREADPRPRISAYHNMPYAIFHYPPDEELPLRGELAMLRTRLEQAGKRVTTMGAPRRAPPARVGRPAGPAASRRSRPARDSGLGPARRVPDVRGGSRHRSTRVSDGR